MGVYIKNMEMPDDCDNCRHPTCDLWIVMDVGNRHPNCPIIEVPEPHGRLIDADALINDHLRTWTTYDLQRIANAPTIIPSSKEGET